MNARSIMLRSQRFTADDPWLSEEPTPEMVFYKNHAIR